MAKYMMDGATFQSLGEWALKYAPCAESAVEGLCNDVVSHLEAMDADDAAYLLDKGWTRVIGDMLESKAFATVEGN